MGRDFVDFSAKDHLCAPNGDGQPLAFHAEDDSGHRLLITLIVRPIPASLSSSTPLFDAISPYGYASPLVINEDEMSNDAYERLLVVIPGLEITNG